MNLKTGIILLGIGSVGLFSFSNNNNFVDIQQDNAGDTTKTQKKLVAAGNYSATIGGCNNNAGGTINKDQFLQLINSLVCGKDNKTNQNYPVASFDLTYCERALSEDSTGYPTIVTDYIMEPINGDAVPEKWKKAFTERLYKGDTVKFENIKIRNGAGQYKSKNNVIMIIGS